MFIIGVGNQSQRRVGMWNLFQTVVCCFVCLLVCAGSGKQTVQAGPLYPLLPDDSLERRSSTQKSGPIAITKPAEPTVTPAGASAEAETSATQLADTISGMEQAGMELGEIAGLLFQDGKDLSVGAIGIALLKTGNYSVDEIRSSLLSAGASEAAVNASLPRSSNEQSPIALMGAPVNGETPTSVAQVEQAPIALMGSSVNNESGAGIGVNSSSQTGPALSDYQSMLESGAGDAEIISSLKAAGMSATDVLKAADAAGRDMISVAAGMMDAGYSVVEIVGAYVSKSLDWAVDTAKYLVNCAVEALSSLLGGGQSGAEKESLAYEMILSDIMNSGEVQIDGERVSTSMASIQTVAQEHGVELHGYQLAGVDELSGQGGAGIAHLDGNHWVAVTAVSDTQVTVVDNGQEKTMTREEFSQRWDGNVLTQRAGGEGELTRTQMQSVRGASWDLNDLYNSRSDLQDAFDENGNARDGSGYTLEQWSQDQSQSSQQNATSQLDAMPDDVRSTYDSNSGLQATFDENGNGRAGTDWEGRNISDWNAQYGSGSSGGSSASTQSDSGSGGNSGGTQAGSGQNQSDGGSAARAQSASTAADAGDGFGGNQDLVNLYNTRPDLQTVFDANGYARDGSGLTVQQWSQQQSQSSQQSATSHLDAMPENLQNIYNGNAGLQATFDAEGNGREGTDWAGRNINDWAALYGPESAGAGDSGDGADVPAANATGGGFGGNQDLVDLYNARSDLRTAFDANGYARDGSGLTVQQWSQQQSQSSQQNATSQLDAMPDYLQDIYNGNAGLQATFDAEGNGREGTDWAGRNINDWFNQYGAETATAANAQGAGFGGSDLLVDLWNGRSDLQAAFDANGNGRVGTEWEGTTIQDWSKTQSAASVAAGEASGSEPTLGIPRSNDLYNIYWNSPGLQATFDDQGVGRIGTDWEGRNITEWYAQYGDTIPDDSPLRNTPTNVPAPQGGAGGSGNSSGDATGGNTDYGQSSTGNGVNQSSSWNSSVLGGIAVPSTVASSPVLTNAAQQVAGILGIAAGDQSTAISLIMNALHKMLQDPANGNTVLASLQAALSGLSGGTDVSMEALQSALLLGLTSADMSGNWGNWAASLVFSTLGIDPSSEAATGIFTAIKSALNDLVGGADRTDVISSLSQTLADAGVSIDSAELDATMQWSLLMVSFAQGMVAGNVGAEMVQELGISDAEQAGDVAPLMQQAFAALMSGYVRNDSQVQGIISNLVSGLESIGVSVNADRLLEAFSSVFSRLGLSSAVTAG